MTLKDFITKYQGKYIDYDGAFGNQCVDLFRQFNKEVLGISQPKGVNGAKDFWANYDTDPNLYNNFDKIKNTPDFIPQAGDVWIWTASYGKYGHIAIESYEQADTNFFYCFSQNDPLNSKCIIKQYKYKYVYGVLRPKNQTNIKEQSSVEPPVEQGKEIMENINRFLQRIGNSKTNVGEMDSNDWDNLANEVNQLKSDKKGLQGDVDKLQKSFEETADAMDAQERLITQQLNEIKSLKGQVENKKAENEALKEASLKIENDLKAKYETQLNDKEVENQLLRNENKKLKENAANTDTNMTLGELLIVAWNKIWSNIKGL